MKDNITPEERLLKLIRREKKPPLSPPGKPLAKAARSLDPRKAVIAALIISCAYFISSFFFPLISPGRKMPLPAPKQLSPRAAQPQQRLMPLEAYVGSVENRQLFGNPLPEADQPRNAENPDLIKDINLVGIVSGENPQAIIEDKRLEKTYYVSKGQSIAGFQVEDIQDGKVVLQYNGQRFELYL